MQPQTLICPNAVCPDLMGRLAADWPGPKASGYALPGLEIPFPVEASFKVRPDLAKLAEGPILVQDSDWPSWTAFKRDEVCAGRLPLVDSQLDDESFEGLARKAAQVLHRLMPTGPVDARGQFPWLGGLRVDNAWEFFSALTMSMQEDFALMVPDARGELVARVLSVAFPSGWDPRQKQGMTMREIHVPVADNEPLMRANVSMEQAMISKGPFVRYVWTLAEKGALTRAAGEDTLAHAQTIADLWYRCERQVTVPLDGMASLFLIRVFVAPLQDVLHAPGRMALLKASLASMTPAMLAYKGIGKAARIVLESPNV